MSWWLGALAVACAITGLKDLERTEPVMERWLAAVVVFVSGMLIGA